MKNTNDNTIETLNAHLNAVAANQEVPVPKAMISTEEVAQLADLLVRFHNRTALNTEHAAGIHGREMTCALAADTFNALARFMEYTDHAHLASYLVKK